MGSINTILPKKIDKDTEEIILKKIKDKMTSGVALYVSTLRWIEEKFGKETIEEIRKYQLERNIDRWKKLKKELKDNSLETFCNYMEKSCAGTSESEKLIDEKNRKKYRYTRCMWAEIFRELDAEDIGFWFCEADEPVVKTFNPNIKFKRTKTLMEGHDCCDHEFYIEKQ